MPSQSQIPCVVQFFRRRASGLEPAVCPPRVVPQRLNGQILVGRASLCASFFLCALNAFASVRTHNCCAVCKFSHVHCVSLACLRARAHVRTPCGVQVFICALCVSMCVIFVWVRVRVRKLPAVCKFCVCVVCLVVCGECLCKRPHAQMRRGVRILLLRGLLAGTPEVAPAGLGPGMASFYYESY